VLADLGADVVLVEPPEGVALRAFPYEWAAWGAGKRSVVVDGPDDARLHELLAGADIVIDTPGVPGSWTVDPAHAPQAVWVHVTPFGADGPRAGWRASDLGVMASSGNMWATGDPDRAPVACTLPSSYAHAAGEVAFAAAVAARRGRRLRTRSDPLASEPEVGCRPRARSDHEGRAMADADRWTVWHRDDRAGWGRRGKGQGERQI
jgi:crotonobetainyl-CoA:carnitine CoA-transferase CaiB-like acyl-CoA transferase